ncbi:MAG: sugar phosphate isomerase/epimerase [Candidatus Methanoperedens sp.]|nr:sugar phosphate isomerase/epimerase [Candidatus Methanoperedens sp.]
MKKIIGASSFASSLPELEKEVKSVELYIPKLRLYDGSNLIKERVDELHNLLSTGSVLTTMHAPYYGDSPNYPAELMVDTANMGSLQWRLMEESISLASEFGCSILVVHPGKISGDRKKSFMTMVRNLKKLSAKAHDCGVILGIENKEGTDPTNLCCTADEHLRAIKEVGSPNLRATFDIGHANLTCGGDAYKLRDFVRKLNGNTAHVHVHDNTGRLSESYFGDLHGAPGEGNIDFSVLRELNFKGVYNLEVFSMDAVRAGKRILESL